MAIKITLEEMLEAGAHFGHQSKRWNPSMADYLYGVKGGVHIFDLAKTRDALVKALEFLKKAAQDKKSILLVGTKKQASAKVKDVAQSLNLSYVDDRWLGGMLTNFNQLQVSIKKLKDLKTKMEKGEFASFTKKERLLIEREIEKLEKKFGGVREMSKLPDIMFVLDTKKESGAVKEAKKMNIPVVGVVDSNSDPNLVDYPIPANDDAVKSIEFVMELVKKAISEGQGKISKTKKEK